MDVLIAGKLISFFEKFPALVARVGTINLDDKDVGAVVISRKDGKNEPDEVVKLFSDPESYHPEWFSCGVGCYFGDNPNHLKTWEEVLSTPSNLDGLVEGLLEE